MSHNSATHPGVTFDDRVPSDDPEDEQSTAVSPSEFSKEVYSEAHRMAREKTTNAEATDSEVRQSLPDARLKLLAERNDGIISRAAEAIRNRFSKIEKEAADAEQEKRVLLSVIEEQESLRKSLARAKHRITFATQIADIIKTEVEQARSLVPGFYTRNQGDGRTVENVIGAYSRVIAGERAVAEFAEVRKKLEAEVAEIERKIASFDKEHADILRT